MDSKAERAAHSEEVYSTPSRKGGIMNKLYPPGPKPGVKGRVKNHCRKFWWCDCLVFALIAMVIVLIIIYVAIPKIAQNGINNSTLEVSSQEVTNPRPDGVQVKLNSVIKSESKFHPKLDGFRAALSLDGKSPFLYVDIPETKSEATTYVTIDQDVKFASLEGFTEYSKVVLGSEEFKVRMDGKTKVHLGGLPSMDVDYNKIITMKGLNHLKGLNISGLKVLAGAGNVLPDGSNMIGQVYIPNPSVMSLDLGNVSMSLSVDGKAIGTTLIPNLFLKPGDNNVQMQARVDQLVVIGLIQSKYKNAILPLEIAGNSSISNGQNLTYFSESIRSNIIKMDLNVGPALSQLGINVTQH